MRLSSKVLEATFIAFARLQLLPQAHPGARMLLLACTLGADTWVARVRVAFTAPGLPEPIPELAECGLFDGHEIRQAQSDKGVRSELLRRYRKAIVRPILQEMDNRILQAAITAHASFPPYSLADFFVVFPRNFMELQPIEWTAVFWLHTRAWALSRISGRWPLTCWGHAHMPYHLDRCPLCGYAMPDVSHALLSCPGTHFLSSILTPYVGNLGLRSAHGFVLRLFQDVSSEALWAAQIQYVGRCIAEVASKYLQASTSDFDEHSEDRDSEDADLPDDIVP